MILNGFDFKEWTRVLKNLPTAKTAMIVYTPEILPALKKYLLTSEEIWHAESHSIDQT